MARKFAPYLPGRRAALKRVGAAGIGLLLPGCGPAGPENSPRAAPPGDQPRGALRLEFRQRVMSGAEAFELDRLRAEPAWPGRDGRLAEFPDWGDYRLSVEDAGDGALLYRHGFDTSLGARAQAATANVSLRVPMPARPVRAIIEKRRGGRFFQQVAAIEVDPSDGAIDRSAPAGATRVDVLQAGGTSATTVDLAILGDGYRAAEYPKFAKDAARAAAYLFSVDPFRNRRGDFGVRSVFAPSADSGVTDPYLGLERNTVLRCAYGSGASERTLAVGNAHAAHELAAAVPYDFLLVIANARRYGGSACYGGAAVVAIDSAAARYLVVHELAHAMAGLADEYYVPAAGGPVYGGNVEPWQPNVTISPARAKWRTASGVARPTRWRQGEYDRRFALYVSEYESLRANGADEAAVEKLMAEERPRQAALLSGSGDLRLAGYYEGANGYAKGMYRSGADCIMFSLQADFFCTACRAALERAIDEECR